MEQFEIDLKREKEKTTVTFMIEIYCKHHHKTNGGQLCPECQELADYACARVEHCPHMADKTFCSNCKTPCYKPEMRARIKQVMRYSGPRMILHCPKLVIRHAMLSKKKKRSNP